MERTWREVFSDCFLFVDGMVLLSFFFLIVVFGHVVALSFQMFGHALVRVLLSGRETGEFGAGVTLGGLSKPSER